MKIPGLEGVPVTFMEILSEVRGTSNARLPANGAAHTKSQCVRLCLLPGSPTAGLRLLPWAWPLCMSCSQLGGRGVLSTAEAMEGQTRAARSRAASAGAQCAHRTKALQLKGTGYIIDFVELYLYLDTFLAERNVLF